MTGARKPNYITRRGHDKLADELRQIQLVERPRVVQEVSDAAAQGDRSENAEYIYGKKRLREIDRRVRYLMKILEGSTVVDPSQTRHTDKVFFGATVTVEDEDGEAQTFQIVGVDEIDPAAGRISYRSPIGGALLGKSEDDEVVIETPGGKRTLVIVEVQYV